jgi:hypothetical protein
MSYKEDVQVIVLNQNHPLEKAVRPKNMEGYEVWACNGRRCKYPIALDDPRPRVWKNVADYPKWDDVVEVPGMSDRIRMAKWNERPQWGTSFYIKAANGNCILWKENWDSSD